MRQGLQAVTGPRSLAVAAVVVLAAATVADAWAARGGRSGGWSGSHSSGASSGGQRSHGGGARSWAPSHHHGGVRSRVIIGAPFAAWPYSYSYGPLPPYYAPSYDSSPADYSGASGSFYYIERLDDPQRPPGTYFCPESGQYYPQVTECSLGWLTVLPTPSVAPE